MRNHLVPALLALSAGPCIATLGAQETSTAVGAIADGPMHSCQTGDLRPALTVPGEYFEDLVTTARGDVYSQAGISGDVYHIRPNGEIDVVATIPYGCGDNSAYLFGNLGMAVGPEGDIWINEATYVPETHGVWRVRRDGFAWLEVPLSIEDVLAPNGLTFDRRGNLYVTETVTGVIWRAGRGEHTAEPWLATSLLVPPPGGFFGANGIVYRRGSLYVVNTDSGTIIKVPIRKNGSPGTPRVVVDGLNGPDNLSLDRFGDLYVVTAYGAQVIRILARDEVEILVDSGLTYPTAVDFGRPHGARLNAFITDYFPVYGAPNIYQIELCPRPRHRTCRGPMALAARSCN
jgi:sugar lactone lactonase YvrE